MKKLTSLTICCTLMLAGAALAQEPEEQASPAAKPATSEKAEKEPKPDRKAKPDRAPQGEPKDAAQHATKPAEDAVKKTAETAETSKPNVKESRAKHSAEESSKSAASVDEPELKTSAPAESKTETRNAKGRNKSQATPAPTATVTPMGTAKPAPTATVTPMGTATAAPTATVTPMGTASPAASATPIGTPVPSSEASGSPAASTSVTTGTSAQVTATAKKPEPQIVEKIKEKHANFRAQPRPEKVPAVTFSANFRLQGSDTWQGPKYEVYRSYRPERHDQGYYRSKYKRVELVSGGYYYYNNGYWYPAWGYDDSAQYYAYDAPIYVGSRAVPPDRIIADVQAALQAMGYYRGEVDGLLGPLTREALTGYQSRQGLTVTAVIDEPTLDALGMG